MESSKVMKFATSKSPEYKSLPIKDLNMAEYQRSSEPANYKRIADDYDPDIFGVVVVSHRDNKYWIVDGAHRIKALKRLNYDKAMCQIMRGLTYEEEADKFLKLNTLRKSLNANQKFVGAVDAKRTVAVDVANILKEYGYKYAKDPSGRSSNTIAAVSACQRIYKKAGHIGFAQVLRILRETWNGDASSLSVQMLSGLGTFIKLYADEFNEKILINGLKELNPSEIEAEAFGKISSIKALRSDSACEHVSKIMWQIYNKRAKTKLPYKFDGLA